MAARATAMLIISALCDCKSSILESERFQQVDGEAFRSNSVALGPCNKNYDAIAGNRNFLDCIG